MSHDPPSPDLPPVDPPLPRFAWLLIAAALIGALWVGVGPVGSPPASYSRSVPSQQPGVDRAGRSRPSGAALFLAEGCGACHPTVGPSTASGPTLAGVVGRASERIRAPDYTGRADTVEGYLREAILDHCLDLVPGYPCPQAAPDVGLHLTQDQLDALLGYVAQVGGGEP